MPLRIELNELPPAEYSANENRGKSFWSMKGAKADALNSVGVALNLAGWNHAEPMKQALVTVTFYLPSRIIRDHGSLIERMKPIWDALTVPTYYKTGAKANTIKKEGYGVLVDDDLNCIGFPTYQYEYRPRQPGMVIEIEEI